MSAELKIYVVGIGGRGLNALTAVKRRGIPVKTIGVDTDSSALSIAKCDDKLLIGEDITKGRSTAGAMELGRRAMEAQAYKIVEKVADGEVVVIISGLGGGTGSGGHPVLVEKIKESYPDKLVISFVTIPFKTESSNRINNAKMALSTIIDLSDVTVVHFNDKLKEKYPTLPLVRAYRILDNKIEASLQAILGLQSIKPIPGVINVDFSSFKAIAMKSGLGLINVKEAAGVLEAFKEAMKEEFCDIDITGSKGAVVYIEGTETALQTSDIYDISGTLTSTYNIQVVYFGFKPSWELTQPRVAFIVTGVKSESVRKFLEE